MFNLLKTSFCFQVKIKRLVLSDTHEGPAVITTLARLAKVLCSLCCCSLVDVVAAPLSVCCLFLLSGPLFM